MGVFIPNLNFAEDFATDEEVLNGLEDHANRLKSVAEPMLSSVGGPWMPRKGHEPLEVVRTSDSVYLVNTDHGGHLIEWGSVNNPPHGVLRNAVRAAGMRLEEN